MRLVNGLSPQRFEFNTRSVNETLVFALCQYSDFILSVSFQQHSTLNFIYMLLSPEGQTGRSLGLFQNAVLLRKSVGEEWVCVCVKNSVYALTAISKINKARTANTNLLFEIPLLALIKAGKAHSQIWKYEQNTAWHNMNPNTQHDTMYSY